MCRYTRSKNDFYNLLPSETAEEFRQIASNSDSLCLAREAAIEDLKMNQVSSTSSIAKGRNEDLITEFVDEPYLNVEMEGPITKYVDMPYLDVQKEAVLPAQNQPTNGFVSRKKNPNNDANPARTTNNITNSETSPHSLDVGNNKKTVSEYESQKILNWFRVVTASHHSKPKSRIDSNLRIRLPHNCQAPNSWDAVSWATGLPFCALMFRLLFAKYGNSISVRL